MTLSKPSRKIARYGPGFQLNPHFFQFFKGRHIGVNPGFGQACRFNSGPRSGTTLDYSHTLGSLPLAIGARCADGASSGIVVGSAMEFFMSSGDSA